MILNIIICIKLEQLGKYNHIDQLEDLFLKIEFPTNTTHKP
jgi:hypothetical protein